MRCDEAKRALVWLIDNELEPALSLELEAHVDTCGDCRAEFEHEGRLREMTRRAGAKITAPPSLRRNIREVLDAERGRGSRWMQLWPAMAAAAVLISFIWRGAGGPSIGWAPELEEAAARHARNLPMDVVSADVSQVQSFFNEKLPFAMRVPRVNAEPLQRLGGRITQLHNRDAAYVRYEVPRGRVSLFVYEDPRPAGPNDAPMLYRIGSTKVQLQRVRGYTVAQWRSSGLVYSVITDLPESELAHVVDFGDGK